MNKGPVLVIGNGKIIPIYSFHTPFTTVSPNWKEWVSGFQPERKGGLIWYTDRFKTRTGTAAAVYGQGTRRKLSFNHGQ